MEKLILEMYKQYAPDVKITDEQLKDMNAHYGGASSSFMIDFEQKVLNPRGIDLSTREAAGQADLIRRAYSDFDVQANTEKKQQQREIEAQYEVEWEDIDPTALFSDDLFTGLHTIKSDYLNIKDIAEPFGFEVSEKNVDRVGTFLEIKAPNGKMLSIKEGDFSKGEENQKIIKEFFNENAPDKDSDLYKEGQKAIGAYAKLGRDINEKSALNEEELEAIDNEASNLDLTEMIDVPVTAEDPFPLTPIVGYVPKIPGQRAPYITTELELKHKEVLETAKDYLQSEKGIENPTKEQIDETAKLLHKRRLAFKLRQRKADEYLETLSDETRSKIAISGKGLISEAGKDLEKDIEYLEQLHGTNKETGLSNFDNDPDVVALKTLMGKYDKFDNAQQRMFNMSEKDRKLYNELGTRVKGKIFDAKMAYSDVAGRISYLETVPDVLELSRRSYNNWFNFASRLAAMGKKYIVGDIVQSGLRHISDIDAMINASRMDQQILGDEGTEGENSQWLKDSFPSLTQESLDKFDVERTKELQRILGQADISPESLSDIRSWEDLGEFSVNVIADMLPIIGTIMATRGGALRAGLSQGAANAVGYGAMFEIGNGNRRSEYAFDEYLNPLDPKTPLFQKMYIAAGHGAAEAVFEGLVTFKLLDKMMSPFGKLTDPDLIKALGKNWKKYLQAAWTRVPAAFGLEGVSEGLTEVSQNLLDGEDMFQNVPEALYGGFLMGGGVGIMTLMHGVAMSKMVDRVVKKELLDDFNELHGLRNQVDELDRKIKLVSALPPSAQKKKATKQIEKLRDQKQTELDAKNESVGVRYREIIRKLPAFDDAVLNKILGKEADLQNIRDKYDLNEWRYNQGEITEEVYEAERVSLELQTKIISNAIKILKGEELSLFRVLKESDDVQEQKLYNQYIEQAEKLDPDNVETKAEELFYRDIYIEKLKTWEKIAKKRSGNAWTLNVKNFTKKQAIKYLTDFAKRNPDSDIAKNLQEEIASINQGKLLGRQVDEMDKNGNWVRTAFGIEENAMRHRRAYTIPHEVYHAIFDQGAADRVIKIDGEEVLIEKVLADGIKEHTKNALPEIYAKIKDAKDIEVFPLFFELLEQFKINPQKHTAFFHALTKIVMPESTFRNPAEMFRWMEDFIKEYNKYSFLSKNFRRGEKKSIDDPKGFAARRDKINDLVDIIALDPDTIDDEDKVKKYIWNDDIARQVLDYAIENKIFDTYILGKILNYQSPKKFLHDVYVELWGPSRTFKTYNRDENNRPDYFGWMMGNLNYQVLDVTGAIIKEQQIKAKQKDIDEARLIAEDIGDTVEDYGFSDIAVQLGVAGKMLKGVYDVVFREIGTYIKDITKGVTKNITLTPIFQQLNKKFAQATKTNTIGGEWRLIQKLLGAGQKYKDFLIQHKPLILDEVTTEYLSRNFPHLVDKVIKGTDEFVGYSKWKGKTIARERSAITGNTAGPQRMRKNIDAISKLTDKEFQELYIPKGKESQGKKEGLLVQLSQILAGEILINDLLNYIKTGKLDKSPITKQLQKVQSLYDRVLDEAKAAEIVAQKDRVKRSAIRGITGLTPKNQQKVFDQLRAIHNMVDNSTSVDVATTNLLEDQLTEKQLKGVIKAMESLVSRFDILTVAPKQIKKLFNYNEKFSDFVLENIKQIEKDGEGLSVYAKNAGILSDKQTFSEESDKEGNINAQRKVNARYSEKKLKDFKDGAVIIINGKEVKISPIKLTAIHMLTYLKGHLTMAGRIGKGQAKLPGEKIRKPSWAIINRVLTKIGIGVGESRGSYYTDVNDFHTETISIPLGINLERSKKGEGDPVTGFKFRNSKGDYEYISLEEIKLNPIGQEKGAIDVTPEDSQTEADDMKKGFFDYVDFLNKQRKDKKIKDYNDLGFMLSLHGLNSDTRSMARRMAPYLYKFVGRYTGLLKYEHLIPTNYIMLAVADYYLKDTSLKELNKLMSKYEVAMIPQTMDDNISLTYLMSATYMWGGSALNNRYYTIYNFGLPNMRAVYHRITGKKYGEAFTATSLKKLRARSKKSIIETSHDAQSSQNFVVAMRKSLDPNAKRKGISIIDFDETLANTKSKITYKIPRRLPDGRFNWQVVGWGAIPDSGSLTPAEFAVQYDGLLDAGAVFNFDEFSKVVDGKKGPFFGKAKALKEKFGNSDIFILSARPQTAALAMQAFLKGIGLDIKIENIIGLEDGTPRAKANWIINKVNEGYNDILFADDAIKNVEAVAEVLDNFDVGGKVYKARQKFSLEGATEEQLDQILNENNPDSPVVGKDVDRAEAAEFGKPKFWLTELFNLKRKTNLIFVPPSAEDLKGLWDNHVAGKGKKGESDKVWFEETIVRPFARAERAMDRIKLAMRTVLINLKKLYGNKFTTGLYSNEILGRYSRMDAVRVYLWNKVGHEIPGLTDADMNTLINYVNKDSQLKAYADSIFDIIETNIQSNMFPEKYPPPTNYWKQQDINSDIESLYKVVRPKLHKEFIDNKKKVFNTKNMNKIEAIYGTQFRKSLEDMFFRMENGINRNQSQLNNPWIKWLNFATGNVMFVNIRSALLQSISMTNFIEATGENNLLHTLARAMDRKQWAADFAKLWNSEFLQVRRTRGKIDIVQEEVMKSIMSEKDPFLKLAGMLQAKGYKPTQFMDSLAIAFGGAAYYRNKVNYYLKKGMNITQAERTAMKDFREKAEPLQQSARADLVSMQQASVAGRIFLTFQNVTMQYTRQGKKAFNNFKNGRRVRNSDGTYKSLNDSRAEYAWQMLQFFVYQNLLFTGLQHAILLMFAFGDGDDVDEKKKVDWLNAAIDSILRGTGILGGALSVVKNIGIEISRGSTYNLGNKVLDISPTISTKYRKAQKIINGLSKGEFKDLLIETPSLIYGLPTDRVVQLMAQLEALVDYHDQGYKAYERLLLSLGWKTYNFGLDKPPSILDMYKEPTGGKTRRKRQGRRR